LNDIKKLTVHKHTQLSTELQSLVLATRNAQEPNIIGARHSKSLPIECNICWQVGWARGRDRWL